MKTSFLDSITEKLSNILVPIGEKMSKSKVFSAISETTQATMAILIIGSFAMLIPELGISWWQDIVWSIPNLGDICYKIYCCTCGFYALYLVFILGFNFSRKLGLRENVVIGGACLATFFMITPFESWSPLPVDWTGTKGILAAMLIGILVPLLFKFLFDRKLYIRMPAGVPKFIEDSFKVLIPNVVVFILVAILNLLVRATPYGDIQNLIYTLIQTPLKTVGLSLPGACLIMALTNAVWWCGIHGDAACAAYYSIAEIASLENLEAMNKGLALPNTITSSFLNSTLPGGYGQLMIPALIAVFFCKSKELKAIGRASFIPSIFNIGEPVLFGIPVMLNAVLFIPLILGQVVNVIIWYVAIATGICGPFTGVSVSWACPMFLMQILGSSTPVAACLVEAVMIAVDVLIWLPFMKIHDNQQVALEETTEK